VNSARARRREESISRETNHCMSDEFANLSILHTSRQPRRVVTIRIQIDVDSRMTSSRPPNLTSSRYLFRQKQQFPINPPFFHSESEGKSLQHPLILDSLCKRLFVLAIIDPIPNSRHPKFLILSRKSRFEPNLVSWRDIETLLADPGRRSSE